MLVVEPDVTFNGAAQVLTGLEAIRRQHVSDSAIEAFDQAVGLRMAWRAQPVLDAQGRTNAKLRCRFALGVSIKD